MGTTIPAVVPHDRDDGPEPQPVTDETTTPDGGPAVTGEPPTEVTKTRKNKDGTEVLEETPESKKAGIVANKGDGGKVA